MNSFRTKRIWGAWLALMLAAAAPQAQAYLGGFEDADGYYNGVAGGIKPPDVAVYNAGEYGTNPGGTGPGGAYTPMPLNSGLWTALAYGAFLDPSTNDESYVVGHEGGNSGASSLAFNNFGGAGELHYTYAFDSRDFGVLPTSVTDGTVTLDFDLCPVWGTGLPAGAYHTMNFKGANGATALSVASYADGTANSNYYTNVGTWVDSGINSNTAGWDHVTITFTLSSSANDKVTLSYTSSISGITTTVLNNVNVANNIDSLALLDFTQVQGANKYYYDNYLVSAAVPCELTVLVPAVSPCSTCPSITMSPVTLPNGTVGTPYSQTLTASGGVAPYTFAVTTGSLPAGLSLNTSTGAITGTPTSTSAASFIITVTDSTGCNASNSFTVTPACPVITVTPNPLSSGTVGTAYSASPSASGGIAPYTWSATGLPAGLSINPSTGAITGTPTASGSATITATDANGCFNSTTLTINPFSCPIITVTPNPLASGTVGTAYSASPVASGAPGGSSYTWTSVGLPAGLTLNATTGAISGTPTATGNATITATYEGPGGEQCQGSTTLAVTAAPCPAITVSPASLPNGTVGTPYSSSVSASGGTAPYTFAVTSGALPAGLSLNGSTGAITGTPTSTTAANFTISVTDDNGCPGSASFTVTPACPVITVTPNPLSSGTVGTAYTASPSVSGGIAPYTWTATGLPAGLSINPSTGAISGTPTAAGSTTITAIDSNGCSGTSTLNVAGPALLSCGMAVGTCASDIDFSASSNNYFKSDGYVVGIMDIRQPPAPSPSTNWMPPIYHNPDWVYGALNSSTGLTDGLGGVFGIAIDNSKNIYLTAFKPYSPNGTSATAAAPGFGGPGAVYKLDASTGAVSLFASLPQSALPGAPMLGNIAYDGENDQFFASNFEDGKIYQLNSSGTIGSSFDPGTPDDSTPGVVATGERVWGIGYYQGRVYYAVWSTGLTNEIRSVAVDSGGNFSDDRSEFTLPMSSNTSSRQTPIADIEFASDGAMLLVERTMDGTAFQSQAHYSKSYEFTYTSGSWNQTHVYYVGDYAGLNTGIRTHAAGGGDYGYTSVDPLTNIGTGEDSRVWLSGDTLKYASGNYIFGFQGIPRDPSNLQTDPTANANLIDANGDTSIIDKYGIGDIDICRPCATAPCPAVAVSPATLPNGTVGTAYSATVSASGGTAPYTFAVTSGALPAGLSLNGSTGAITGTPTSTTAANFTISVTDDNGCPGSASFTVTPACPVITVTPNPLSSGTVGTAYSASPSASGGIAPYTWTATGLPAGLSINPSTGAISGTPTIDGNATITATDANGCFNTTTLTINPFSCPIITVTPDPLASGTVGTAYNASPAASGAPGGSSYTWTSVGLPAGLTLDSNTGTITGTPTATGNATITATYQGPGGEQCQGSTTLEIKPYCCPQIFISIPN